MSKPIAADSLYQQIRELLRHIHDPDYLRRHHLAAVLCPQMHVDDPRRGPYLRRRILEAIDQLSPPADAAVRSKKWMQSHILIAHYLEGRGSQEILSELAISERQFYREQRQAVQALSGLLWEEMRIADGSQLAEEQPDLSSAQLDLREEARWFPGKRELIDLVELIAGVLESVDSLLRRPIPVACRADVELPPVRAYRTMLRQIFIHVLGRCLTQPGTKEVEIAFATEGRSVGAQIAVSGDAPPRSDIEAALSLDTVRSLIGIVGGEWQELRVGDDGYEVAFLLPTSAARTILGIENNPGAVKLLERYLIPYGYHVVGAASGEEAFRLVRELTPDLILLDIMLPQQDGWEVLTALKTDPISRDIPVLICSVLHEPQLASALGADGYLLKPFSQAEILDALDELWTQEA